VQDARASHSWTPPDGPLGALTRDAWRRAEAVAPLARELAARVADLPPVRSLHDALWAPTVAVIAEVKRASPSKGPLAPALEAAPQARRYAAGGAAAISVLTEPTRFGGALDDLREVAQAVALPVIRKDFLVDPVQLWEARAHGADAALLIVRALAPDQLPRLLDAGARCGLELLVEVRTPHELERALAAGARIIGVNNRDLETLIIDPARAHTLIPAIPPHCVRVAESGMQAADDVRRAAVAGADAVLVGSAVSVAADPEAAVRGLTGVPGRRGTAA
jgi:indole-3-glycerol phosphate synthase